MKPAMIRVRALGVLVVVLVVALACATAGRSSREEGMAILHKRPIAGCHSIGSFKGTGGGLGGAFLADSTLETYATNDLLQQAGERGATHVLVTGEDYHRNAGGNADAVTLTGEGFVCDGMLKFAADAPPEPKPKLAASRALPKTGASGLRALDSGFWRSWGGSATQPGYGSFDVQLGLSRSGASGACGAAEYPTLGCRGVLTQCEVQSDGSVTAVQRLEVVGKCSDGGKLRLKANGSALETTWLLPNGRTVATARLAPLTSSHPLLAQAEAALPNLPSRQEPVFDDEIFEVLPQFLPDVLPAGFVTDEPSMTSLGAGSRFRVVRRYLRQDGAEVVFAILLVRSLYEGASATLTTLQKGKEIPQIAGFPLLRRPAPAGSRQSVFLVLSPRLQLEVEAVGVDADMVARLVQGLPLGYLAQVEAHGRAAAAALSKSQDFEDQQGETVRMASGQSAFADRVIRSEAGTGQRTKGDANLSLGPPDLREDAGYYTLGCGGRLEVAFEDNVLEDGPGADLHIFEIGGFVEAMRIRISTDGKSWLDAGQVKGQPASLDIAGVAAHGAQYHFVEATDLGTECSNKQAGADIDAIGALHGEFVDAPVRRPSPRSNTKKPGGASAVDDPRRVAEAVQKNEGVPLKVDVSGQGWTLSETKGGYTVKSSGMVRADLNGDGRKDAVVINTRGDATRREHQLEIYTERDKGVGPLAQAVIGYDDPLPTAGTLAVNGSRIDFSMSGMPFTYELRHGALIRVQP